MNKEKTVTPYNGYLMLSIFFVLLLSTIGAGIFNAIPLVIIFGIFLFFIPGGLFIVNPNSSKVLLLFGAYKGSVKQNGFYWINPFYKRIGISLRARNFESDKIKASCLLLGKSKPKNFTILSRYLLKFDLWQSITPFDIF